MNEYYAFKELGTNYAGEIIGHPRVVVDETQTWSRLVIYGYGNYAVVWRVFGGAEIEGELFHSLTAANALLETVRKKGLAHAEVVKVN